MSSETMRATLRLIVQICDAADDGKPFDPRTTASILARIHTIAHVGLIKEPSGVVVDLGVNAIDDLGRLRSGLRCLRLESGPAEEVAIDRLVKAIDDAQHAAARVRAADPQPPTPADLEPDFG